MKDRILFGLLILLLPVVIGAKTCSDYWGDCSSRTIDDAFDPCDGKEVGGDEHVSEIYIEGEVIEPNEIQVVTCTFVPTKYWSLDKIYIYYFDGDTWNKLLEGVAKYRYAYNETISFNVGIKEGEKIVRCIISRDPVKGECAQEGQYYDNDDLKFLVRVPLNCSISCSEREEFTRKDKINCEYNCNKKVKIYYNFDLSNNYTLGYGREGTFQIDFSNFPEGGKYNLNIFVENISKQKIYSKNLTLKSEAIISSISVPEVARKEVEIICEVEDLYTSYKINNYQVYFFVDNQVIGNSSTKNGKASIEYSSEIIGDKNITCSIKDSKFYFANSSKTKTVYFSEFKGFIDVKELKEMEAELKKLKEDYYELSFHSNISKEFSINLNKVKQDLVELENYLREGKIENFKEKSARLRNKIADLKWTITLHSLKKAILNKFVLISILAFVLILISYKLYSKEKRREREINFYKNMERELIEKRKQIERDYFARKIDESYFNRLLLENYDRLSKVRAKLKELSQNKK